MGEPPPSEQDKVLLDRLWTWRREQAQAQKKPAYVIFHNSVLQRIAAVKPPTLDELIKIKGIGPAKLEKYGLAVIALLRDCENEKSRV